MIPGVDRDSQPWWDALARHELVHQRCDACGRWRWPPRVMCGECGSFDWSWQPVSGRGVVLGWTRTHHSFLPGLDAPYVNVQVGLDEQDDVTIIGLWQGDTDPAVGEPVEAHFLDQDDGTTVLAWASSKDARATPR